MIGDLLLVVVFHMGVAGVAIATIIAQLLSALGCIVYAVKKNPYFRLTKENFRPDPALMKKMSAPRHSVRCAGQSDCIFLCGTAEHHQSLWLGCHRCIHSDLPDRAARAAAVQFSGDGACHLCGTEYWSRQPGTCPQRFSKINVSGHRVQRDYVRDHVPFRGSVVRLFVKDANVIAIGGRAIRITSLFYIRLGMIYITRSLLNGAGDSAFAFVSGLAEVVGRVGFSILLAGIPALGYWAVWYTTGLTWLITGAACILRYLQGKWERIVLVEK